MTELYLAAQNSDLTEGRGRMVGIGLFDNEDEAVKAVRGKGVMGVGDGEVFELLEPDMVFHTAEEWRAAGQPRPGIDPSGPTRKVYGYRKDWKGNWGYGWVDNRDAPVNDPEYDEFLRLKRKFGDN